MQRHADPCRAQLRSMSAAAPSVAWAWAGLPCLGNRVSGDLVLIGEDAESPCAVVVDVAGHGPAAHTAAQLISSLQPLAEPMADASVAVRRIHDGLAGSGAIAAVMALRILPGGGAPTLEFCGLGNVRLAVSGHTSRYEGQPGMAGLQARSLRVQRIELEAESTVVVFTDGITGKLDVGPELVSVPAQQLPMLLLRRHARRYDDATCLVARLGYT